MLHISIFARMVNAMFRKMMGLPCCLIFLSHLQAQELKPGFDKEEYVALMKVSAQFGDTGYASGFAPPEGYRLLYRSPVMGLENRWDLWQTDRGVPILSIRGTTKKEISWLANFYAAMVPAKGQLHLTEGELFRYTLAENPQAAVHTGWLIATGFLAKDMLPKIDSFYRKGNKQCYIMGHSQGGAIAYLLTAYLAHLQKEGKLPADLRLKTYCSAAPKPGNLYFAYEYETLTQEGWAYNVVNALDWVPQSPFSVQTVDDFVSINPFTNARPVIRKSPIPKRWVLSYAYGRLSKPAEKARKNYRRFLGKYVAKSIKKALPGFKEPAYYNSSDYVRAGNIIALVPKQDYYQKFPQAPEKTFANHLHGAYLYLVNKIGMQNRETDSLHGSWELTHIGDKEATALYPEKRPLLRFEGTSGKMSGTTGCNNFQGQADIIGSKIHFPESMAMTKMMCSGNGEQVFLEALKKCNSYRVEGNELKLLDNETVVMEFVKSR